MLERFFNWLADWLLARIGQVRAEELRQATEKETADAQARIDHVKPVSPVDAAQRLRDGSA